MEDDKKDPPVTPMDFVVGVKVVDIGDIRVARGLTRRPYSGCKHNNLVYDPRERRIWCEDCENNIEPFDAFEGLVSNYDQALSGLERIREETSSAKNHALHLIACKNLEKTWRGRRMAPTCPHCKGGLLPEDFSSGGLSISAEIERQRRKNEKTKAN